MPPILVLALLAPSTALGATTGTVTVLLGNTGVGSFAPSDPVALVADGDLDGFDKSVSAPTGGSYGPGVTFTAPLYGLATYTGTAGSYQLRVSFPDGSGIRVLTLASGVQFPGSGNYWVSKAGVTTSHPGNENAFEIANQAPLSLSIASCAPAPANPTQNLAMTWSNPGPRPADFERFTLERATMSGTTWTTVGTYSAWAVTNFTDTSLTPGTTYRYRLTNRDRYDAITYGAEKTCTTAGGDGDGDGQVSTAYGGFDCDDTNASIYRGAPEVPNDGVDQDCDGRDHVVLDTDGDGLVDTEDNCFEASNPDQLDLDLDGAGDACDIDDDNDGISDGMDVCPEAYDPTQADLDGDLAGDACDDDDDDDGVDDEVDNCPRLGNADQDDLDHDLAGDACDGDDDGDGVADLVDVCPEIADADQADADGDGIGDACDPVTDTDEDLVVDAEDNCPYDTNPDQLDTDTDAAGDACDVDDDNDGIEDDSDLCPVNEDPLQEDRDGDSLGNACDEDDDNDAIRDEDDNCVFDANASQADLDADGSGDACDEDDDGDAVADADDNCVTDPNGDQRDNDGDGLGDTCDPDDDDDGWSDGEDLCAFVSDPEQADADCDGSGDACDDDRDGDGVGNESDSCPDVAALPIELVEDGCPDDACDLSDWITARDTSEIASQMRTSLLAQADHACADAASEEGIAGLGALANHVRAQRGRKVASDTADQLLEVISWIETAWTCEQSGVDCDLLDTCVDE